MNTGIEPEELVDNNSVGILVVEDSLTQAVKLQYTLQENRFQVRLVRNGAEALQSIKENKPTIIISDIVMPKMDGYELCRKIKSDPSTKDIPVILLTALSDLQDVVKALESGADNFITKPYTEKFLLSRIRHVLVNQRLRSRNRNSDGGIDVFFAESRYSLSSEPAQIADLLLSTFENAVQKNLELQDANQQLLAVQQELKQKNIQLKRLNEQKDSFLGMAAHDLRNPLGHISLVADMLSMDLAEKLTGNQKELLDLTRNSSAFMLQLINELLDITKIESGKLELNLQSVDLISLMEHNILINRNLSRKKAIDILFQSGESRLELMLDSQKIEQVLNNLINNAVKFSFSDTVITVGLIREAGKVIISVKDQGQGIPADEINKLFEPFKRTSVQSTAGEKSTGLGLAIVRKIVLGHQGNIWVESEVGVGTTFYVSLPIVMS